MTVEVTGALQLIHEVAHPPAGTADEYEFGHSVGAMLADQGLPDPKQQDVVFADLDRGHIEDVRTIPSAGRLRRSRPRTRGRLPPGLVSASERADGRGFQFFRGQEGANLLAGVIRDGQDHIGDLQHMHAKHHEGVCKRALAIFRMRDRDDVVNQHDKSGAQLLDPHKPLDRVLDHPEGAQDHQGVAGFQRKDRPQTFFLSKDIEQLCVGYASA